MAIARQWLTSGMERTHYSSAIPNTGKGLVEDRENIITISSKKTGVMAKNTWIGKHYVNSKGQRVKIS